VDFDKCIAEDGQIDPFARGWLKSLGGYQERSVSGTGIHAVVRSGLPEGRGRAKPDPGGLTKKVELYDRKRFFCFTGRVRRDFEEIEDAQSAVNEFLNTLFPSKPRKKPRAQIPSNLDDADLLDRARNSASGRKFTALFDKGNTGGYGSHSEADFALINQLIFWCAGDGDRVIRLFEQSALFRDDKHKNYVTDSVHNALASYSGEFYDEARARRAVERALPEHIAMLLQPIWTERKAVSAFKAYAALLVMSSERGVKVEHGIRVGVDIRTLSEICNVRFQTLSENALPWLVRKRLIRWQRGKGERAGYFILRTAQNRNTVYIPTWTTSVPGLRNARELIRLCYGVSSKAKVKRVGSFAAMLLLPMSLHPERGFTPADISRITARRPNDVRRILKKLVRAGLVVEADAGDIYHLPADFWERLEVELEASGVAASERSRKRRHDAQREKHRAKILKSKGLSPERIAVELGIDVERVREMLKEPDKPPPKSERPRTSQKVKVARRARNEALSEDPPGEPVRPQRRERTGPEPLTEEEQKDAEAIGAYEGRYGEFGWDQASAKKLFYKTGRWPDAATLKKLRDYQELIHQGMTPRWAREELSGAGRHGPL
jgi:primase/DNA polymerase family protein